MPATLALSAPPRTSGLKHTLRGEQRYPVHEFATLRLHGCSYGVTIFDLSRSGLAISVTKELPVDGSVELRRQDGTVLNCEVRYCHAARDESFHAGLRIITVPSERRQETRYPVDDPATLAVIGNPNAGEIPVLVRDISKSGIGITIALALPKRARVQINMRSSIIIAIVQYSRRLDDGTYLAGCRITNADLGCKSA